MDRDGTEGPTPCVCPGAEIMGGERRNRKELILPRMGCNYYHRVSTAFLETQIPGCLTLGACGPSSDELQ